ncbi:hypothetical protein B0H34DRAFT_86734 [Crassisporium funariophilum]|nr:hypothetical protein B0H34DRAFT_86734 [Crassisporium funariophilum]
MTVFESSAGAERVTPFPFDILTNILDELSSRRDLRTLIAFSQTCHSLLFCCRRYIFSNIILGGKDDSNDAIDRLPAYTDSFTNQDITGISFSISKFKCLIDSSPYIAGYVRQLELYLNPSTKAIFEVLPQGFLEQLNRICTLSFTSRRRLGQPGRSAWISSSPSPLGNSLKNILRLPTLTHLSMCALEAVPITTFVDCTNLTKLTLHRISFLDDSRSYDLESRDSCSQLRDFRVTGDTTNDLGALLTAGQQVSLPLIDFSSITRLDISIHDTVAFAFTTGLFQRIHGIKSLSIDSMVT